MLKRVLCGVMAAAAVSALTVSSYAEEQHNYTMAQPYEPGVIDFNNLGTGINFSTSSVNYWNNAKENSLYLNQNNCFAVAQRAENDKCISFIQKNGTGSAAFYNFPAAVAKDAAAGTGNNTQNQIKGIVSMSMDFKYNNPKTVTVTTDEEGIETETETAGVPNMTIEFGSLKGTSFSSTARYILFDMKTTAYGDGLTRFNMVSTSPSKAGNSKAEDVCITENGLPYDTWISLEIVLNIPEQYVWYSITPEGEPAITGEYQQRIGTTIQRWLDGIKIARGADTNPNNTFYIDNFNVKVDKLPVLSEPVITEDIENSQYTVNTTVYNEWSGYETVFDENGEASADEDGNPVQAASPMHKPLLLICTYDKDNRLISCTSESETADELSADTEYPLSCSVPKTADDASVRAYLLTNGSIQPLTEIAELTPTVPEPEPEAE